MSTFQQNRNLTHGWKSEERRPAALQQGTPVPYTLHKILLLGERKERIEVIGVEKEMAEHGGGGRTAGSRRPWLPKWLLVGPDSDEGTKGERRVAMAAAVNTALPWWRNDSSPTSHERWSGLITGGLWNNRERNDSRVASGPRSSLVKS